MGITNSGSQTLIFDFRYPAKGATFGRLNRDVIKPGIYKGMNISFIGQEVFVNEGKVAIKNKYGNEDNLMMKIDFDSIFTYGQILPSQFGQNEILYIEYFYAELVENYADFRRQSIVTWLNAPDPNAIIIGELVFNEVNEIVGIDYSRKTWGSINADNYDTMPDKLIYSNTDNYNKYWTIGGERFTEDTKNLQFQILTENNARILLTNETNTTIVENKIEIRGTEDSIDITNGTLVITGGVGIGKRLNVGQFYGRVPLGGVIAVVGTRSLSNNGGSIIIPSGIPTSGQMSEDGFQICDGSAVASGSILTGYVPNITDDRFIQGSSSMGILSSINGANKGDNTILLTANEIPIHGHSVSLNSANIDHQHYFNSYNSSITYVKEVFVGELGDNNRHDGWHQFRNSDGNDMNVNMVGGDRGWLVSWINQSSSIGADGYSGGMTGNQSHSHGVNQSNFGSGQSFDIRPKFISGIYLMRVK